MSDEMIKDETRFAERLERFRSQSPRPDRDTSRARSKSRSRSRSPRRSSFSRDRDPRGSRGGNDYGRNNGGEYRGNSDRRGGRGSFGSHDRYRPSRRYSRSPPRRRERSPFGDRERSSRFSDRRGGDRRDRAPPSRSNQSKNPECRVYVGNLAYETKWYQLKDFMREAGEVVFADVLTMRNGRSKGSGIVEYATKEQAETAIKTLSNRHLLGRELFLKEDRDPALTGEGRFGAGDGEERRPREDRGEREERRPREDRGERGDRFGSSARGIPAGSVQLFVSNLPFRVTWQDMKDLFRDCGSVLRTDVQTTPDRRSKGCGTVLFETKESAEEAIAKFNGYVWDGRPLEVREDKFVSSGSNPPPSRPARLINEFTDNATGDGEPSDTIFVGNLPWATSNQDLVELFETVGRVERAEIQYESNGRSKGNGVVKFDTPASAEIAISKFTGYNYGNRNLQLSYVQYDTPSRQPSNTGRRDSYERRSSNVDMERNLEDQSDSMVENITFGVPMTEPEVTEFRPQVEGEVADIPAVPSQEAVIQDDGMDEDL